MVNKLIKFKTEREILFRVTKSTGNLSTMARSQQIVRIDFNIMFFFYFSIFYLGKSHIEKAMNIKDSNLQVCLQTDSNALRVRTYYRVLVQNDAAQLLLKWHC